MPQPRLLDGDIVGKRFKFNKNAVGKSESSGKKLTSPRCPSVGSTGLVVRWSVPVVHPSSRGEAVPAPCPVLDVSGSSWPFSPGGEEESRDSVMPLEEGGGEVVGRVESSVVSPVRSHRANSAVKANRAETNTASGVRITK